MGHPATKTVKATDAFAFISEQLADPAVVERLTAAALDDPSVAADQAAAMTGSKWSRLAPYSRLADRGLVAPLPADPADAEAEAKPAPALSLVADAPAAPSQGLPRPGSTRAPVVNHAAENNTLAHVLADNALLDGDLADLTPDHFFDRSRREIFAAMRDLHRAGKAFDAATLQHAVASRGARADVLLMLGQVQGLSPDPRLADTHADIVRVDFERRTAAEAAEMLTAAGSIRRDPGELAARVRELIERIDPSDKADDLAGVKPWPEPPAEPAWIGVAGELVAEIDPHTEADPVAVLAQLLVCFGSVIGRSAHWSVDANRHHCNLFAVIVGQSSRGRKGTSWSIVKNLVGFLDPDWRRLCVRGGMTSGEGFIEQIRDASVSKATEFDPGVEDKRALWVESEFSATIGVMSRDGSILSGILRKAWDGDDLASMSRHNPVRATDPHCSIIGHTTFAELSKRLSQTEILNGFANRFLWVCARRSKELPEGGDVSKLDLDRNRHRLKRAFDAAVKRGEHEYAFDAAARERWHAAYGEVSRPRPGRLGSITDRAEAQVRRLAVTYAVLDRAQLVKLSHLEAALAFWDYCERSARYVFGDAEADPFADKVLAAVRAAGKDGATRDHVNRSAFGGRESGRVGECLRTLAEAGLLDVQTVKKGRRTTCLFTIPSSKK